ncbi:MAG: SAM-dependent methyltransferase [Acidobacteria bacterium]|nr:SAM-dependent methyltransferase [Acidobacteriota bacterium]
MGWIESIIESRGGEVSFAEFMELALYDPDHGYYSGTEPRYGRRGDFLTAPTASHWYSRVLSNFLVRMADEAGPVTFVDLAAGDGSLLAGVSEALGRRVEQVLERCVAVERSPVMQGRLALRLPAGAEVVADLRQAEQLSGPVVVHASELYDALPVERVIAGDEGLDELWVAVVDDSLVWRQRPAREEVAAYFSEHRVRLEPGQVAEANLKMQNLHRRHLRWAGEDALILTLDYGYDARRLYDARGRGQGSLACYRRHQLSRNPLESPGEQDITAHVNWDDLRAAARAQGWKEIGFWPLAEYLVRAGLAEVVETFNLGMEAPMDARTVRERQEIKRLLDPEGMGSDLKMMIQGRGRLAALSSAICKKP